MSEITKQIEDGGAAFPCQPLDAQGQPLNVMEFGMSLRDWFAGQALAGKCGYSADREIGGGLLAKEAYEIADFMISARKLKV